MLKLTSMALAETNIEVSDLERHVYFDSEEECQVSQGGDWGKRLATVYGVRVNDLG